MLVDDRYLDIDFTREEAYTFGDTGDSTFGTDGPSYESVEEMIDEAKWQEIIEKIEAENLGLENLITRIYDQSREGACVANATGQGHETVQAKQFGKENVVHLSAISLYKRIGRSPSSGSNVRDALAEIQNGGLLPLDTPENRTRFGSHVMPNTGFYTPFPSGWQETAAKFKGCEASPITTLQGLVTCSLKFSPIIVGREGHSICYIRPLWHKGQLAFLYPNSWGKWGQGAGDFDYGFGVDTLSQVKKSATWAFGLRTVTVPTE